MTNHTKGPWEWLDLPKDGGSPRIISIRVRGHNVEECDNYEEENAGIIAGMQFNDTDPTNQDIANANLIAAAPDLLAACEGLLSNPDASPDWGAFYAATSKAKGIK